LVTGVSFAPTLVRPPAMTGLWHRLPLPEHHVAGLLVGLTVDRLTRTRLPQWTRPAGLALVVAGVAINAAAVRARGDEDLDRPSGLVRGGPYGWTRNPMYLGWSMIHLGTALILRSPGMSVTWPPAVALVHRGILAEEGELAAQFGADFATYVGSVPRYLDRSTGQAIIRSARAHARTPRPRSGTRRRAW
jgi:protein-S-isoprenylcysteine O-methyltransferase Ste14